MFRQPHAPIIRYQYDALDRLISHRRMDSLHRQRFYCESHLVTEIQDGKQFSIIQYADQLLAQRQQHGDEAGCTLLATDQQRSVRYAITANHKRLIEYSPYGHRPAESELTSLLGFNGQRPDSVTGHYLLGNGYRAFNSVLMRFNSPDPLSPFGKGGLNAYTYCLGDPINGSDPTGNIPEFFSRIPGLSKLFTKSAKPAVPDLYPGHLRNITKIADGVFAAKDFYKNKPRITIVGHMGAGLDGIKSNGSFIGPDTLNDLLLAQGYKIKKNSNVRLLVCHSANSNYRTMGTSYAENFAVLTRSRVKGYRGTVTVQPGDGGFSQKFQSLEVGQRYLSDFYLKPKKTTNHYDPVMFNGMEIRKTRIKEAKEAKAERRGVYKLNLRPFELR